MRRRHRCCCRPRACTTASCLCCCRSAFCAAAKLRVLAVYRRVFTLYRRVFTASVYPCHRGRSPLLHYLMAVALLPRLSRSSPSPSVRVRDDCLVGCSVKLAGVGRCGRCCLWPSVAADRVLCRRSARIRPTCRSWRTSSAFSNGNGTNKHMPNPTPEPRALLSDLESPNVPLPRCRPSGIRTLRTDLGWAKGTRHVARGTAAACCVML
jgi:hypothetical protein